MEQKAYFRFVVPKIRLARFQIDNSKYIQNAKIPKKTCLSLQTCFDRAAHSGAEGGGQVQASKAGDGR